MVPLDFCLRCSLQPFIGSPSSSSLLKSLSFDFFCAIFFSLPSWLLTRIHLLFLARTPFESRFVFRIKRKIVSAHNRAGGQLTDESSQARPSRRGRNKTTSEKKKASEKSFTLTYSFYFTTSLRALLLSSFFFSLGQSVNKNAFCLHCTFVLRTHFLSSPSSLIDFSVCRPVQRFACRAGRHKCCWLGRLLLLLSLWLSLGLSECCSINSEILRSGRR